MTAPLDALFRRVERGEYPPADMSLTLLPQPSARSAVVLGFTAHTVIAADIDAAWISTVFSPHSPGHAFNPPFLAALEHRLGLHVGNIDLLTMAPPLGGSPAIDLQKLEDQTHPRVRRALRYRTDLTIWTCPGGLVLVGRGLGDRWEVALEVEPEFRGKGLGRALAEAARHLVPDNRPIWAQISVGNAASARALLAAGYLPVGEEALLSL